MTITKEQLSDFRKVLRSSMKPLDAIDPYYVANLHGSGAQDVVQRLGEFIQETDGSGLYYFTGQRGTGKSTELRRLKTLLDGQGYRCILFDSLQYLNEAQPIEAEMLMLMVAAGLADWLTTEYPKEGQEKDGIGTRFWAWLQSDVSVESATVGGVKLSIKAQQESITQKIHDLRSRQRFHQALLGHIAEMAEFVREREGCPVVIIVDSLENLRGNALTNSTDAMFASVARVFGDQADMLKVVGVHMVYSVPPYLCLLENVRRYVSWFALASVRVYEDPKKHRRQPREMGLDIMRRVLDKRRADWRSVLQQDALDRLSLLSGGDLRTFLRTLIDVLYEAQFALDRLPLAASDPILENMARRQHAEMLELTVREEWPLLAEVTRRNDVVVADHGQRPTLAHLLDVKVILNYRNGTDWYDIHPSLWEEIDAYQASADARAADKSQ